MHTQEEQDSALKVLSDLVKENQQLKYELDTAKQFAIRMLLSDEVHKSGKSVYFFDDGVIEYQEDFDLILNHFFFDFNPNSNCNEVDGKYVSSFSVRIKDGGCNPATGKISEVMERLKELESSINN